MTTITSNIETLVEGLVPDRAELWITAPAVKVGDNLHSGGLVKVPYINGKINEAIIGTDTPDTDPVTWLYGFQVKWRGGSLPKFYAEITGDLVDLDTITPVDPAAPAYQPQVIALNKVEGLQAALDAKAEQADLTSGLATKATPAEVGTAIDNAMNARLPGTSLQYVERLTNFTTTSTSPGGTGNIDTLLFTVVGTGRRVQINLYLPSVWHSTANLKVIGYLAVDGSTTGGKGMLVPFYSPATTAGPPAFVSASFMTTLGQSYVVQGGLYATAAGTTTSAGNAYQRMTMEAIAR